MNNRVSHIFLLLLTFTIPSAADPQGFLSLSCGAQNPFTDPYNISWTPDSPYIANTGNVTSISSISLRFFPGSDPRTRICYHLPVPGNASSVLVRPSFAYKNYDGLGRAPAFAVSLGTATSVVNLSQSDPIVEEFVWKVNERNTLTFCLHSLAGGGTPVISSLEIRPLPKGAYEAGSDDSGRSLLRKRYRISCGFVGSAPLR